MKVALRLKGEMLERAEVGRRTEIVNANSKKNQGSLRYFSLLSKTRHATFP